MTVQPSYSSCEAFGFEATFNTAGCSYTFNANGTMTLSGCTAGGMTIRVHIPFLATCVVEIPNQTGLNGISYSNMAGDMDLTIRTKNMDVEVKESKGACPLTVGTHNDGGLHFGESIIEAEGTTIAWSA